MSPGVAPGSVADGSAAELDLRAARARRRARLRHARIVRRTRSRRRAARLSVALGAAVLLSLFLAAGPKSAAPVRRAPARAAAGPRCPVPQRLRPVFLEASQEMGVPLSLLAAVAHVESRFDPAAHSGAGAVGVLQLMPQTASALHYDAEETAANVMAGAVYLRQLLVRYRSTALALAAYNAGPTAVDRAGPSPTEETAAYVENVQRTWRTYGNCA
jgi:soluble lytic murein transglycosylase-like protein